MLVVIHVNKVHMAIGAIVFELIMVLVTYSFPSRHILHLVLDGLALVAFGRRIGALLLHSLHIEAFSILYDIFWAVLIPLQHLAHIRVASVELQAFNTHIKGVTGLGAQTYPHLCLLPHVFIIVKNGVALTRIQKSPHSSLSLLLVVVGVLEITSAHWVVTWLLEVFDDLQLFIFACTGQHSLHILFFVKAKVDPTTIF